MNITSLKSIVEDNIKGEKAWLMEAIKLGLRECNLM
jgi:hypothetical protein